MGKFWYKIILKSSAENVLSGVFLNQCHCLKYQEGPVSTFLAWKERTNAIEIPHLQAAITQ
jgi:hypothetical protein